LSRQPSTRRTVMSVQWPDDDVVIAPEARAHAARVRLTPVLASRLREPPPTEEEIERGLARLSWRDRRYG